MDAKERLAIPPQPMPEQSPHERIGNQREVPQGYGPEAAMKEACRCVRCKRPFCTEGCPVGIDIPGFLEAVEKGDFALGIRIIKRRNVLPAVCGRVCPQEAQCQLGCTVGKFHHDPTKSVGIGKIERFLADWERATGKVEMPTKAAPTGRKIAVVGSGPAGLTVAGDMIVLGHSVTVFEALHKPGGVLVYGIPEFRLPKEIVSREAENLKALGVEFRLSTVVGRTYPMEEVLEDFDAVFIGSGAGLPKFMGVPGENLLGVFSANEYLTRANLMRAFDFPANDTPIFRGRKVITVGGGNVAMDCARTALRMGAGRSLIVYRRSETELPARIEEVHHAKEEGVEFHLLQAPLELIGDERGWVSGMKIEKMGLGEPDSSGRRRPIPIKGSEFVEETDSSSWPSATAPTLSFRAPTPRWRPTGGVASLRTRPRARRPSGASSPGGT